MSIRTLALLLVLGAAGCHAIEVVDHHDPSADFSQYHTYAFAPVADQSVPDPADVEAFDARMRSVLTDALAAKGLTPSDDPDLLIGWFADIHKKRAVHQVGQRYSYAYGWTQGQTRVYDYAEGTLKLEFADAKTNALVWESTAEGSSKYDSSEEARTARLRELVQRMLQGYPPAGS